MDGCGYFLQLQAVQLVGFRGCLQLEIAYATNNIDGSIILNTFMAREKQKQCWMGGQDDFRKAILSQVNQRTNCVEHTECNTLFHEITGQ